MRFESSVNSEYSKTVSKLRKFVPVFESSVNSEYSKTGSKASIMAYESGLHIRLAVHAAATAEELAQKAMSKGIHILPVKAAESSSPEILLSFAGIAEEDIEPALLELKKVWQL